MAISLWPSAFKAQDPRLAFPTIADIKAMALASFTASSIAHGKSSPIARSLKCLVKTNHSITVPIPTEAFEIANFLSITQGSNTLSLIDSAQHGGLIHNIKKARRMNSIAHAFNNNIAPIAPTEVNKTANKSNIVDDRKDTTKSTNVQATAPIVEDNEPAQVSEVSQQVEPTQDVDIIVDDNRNETSSIIDEEVLTIENNKHTYQHVLPTIDITEVNISMASKITDVADVDEMGASASSIAHDFERFLKEDKMQWVHAVPSQPELCSALSKTKKQATKVTKPSTQDNKAIAFDIKLLADNKGSLDAEVDIVHHSRRLSNEYVIQPIPSP